MEGILFTLSHFPVFLAYPEFTQEHFTICNSDDNQGNSQWILPEWWNSTAIWYITNFTCTGMSYPKYKRTDNNRWITVMHYIGLCQREMWEFRDFFSSCTRTRHFSLHILLIRESKLQHWQVCLCPCDRSEGLGERRLFLLYKKEHTKSLYLLLLPSSTFFVLKARSVQFLCYMELSTMYKLIL